MDVYIDLQGHNDFEYDARALVGAYFPGADISAGTCGAAVTNVISQPADDAGEVSGGALTLDIASICAGAITKNEMRRLIYAHLHSLTGRELPWGVLTGVRPTKLAMGHISKSIENERTAAGVARDNPVTGNACAAGKISSAHIAAAARFMQSEYLVSADKSVLASVIAARELSVVSALPGTTGEDRAEAYSLYVGVPFCPSRCNYCSFASNPIDKRADAVEPYLAALFRELEAACEIMAGRRLHSVYIGGGTPTALEEKAFAALLDKVGGLFCPEATAEYTVEAGRPDSITPGKLAIMKNHGVTRISVNPQTMNQRTLDAIGRRHSVEEFIEKFGLARDCGFDNINTDIILGLADETPEDVAHTIEELEKLRPESLTVHALAIKRASRMNIEADGRARSVTSAADAAEMMRISNAGAARMGLNPYYLYRQKNMAGALENVGYAREGAEGIYNILMMEELESIVACGAGTVTKIVRGDGTIERCDTAKDIDEYIKRIDEMIERKRELFS